MLGQVDAASVALARESFNFAFNRIVDEMLALRVFANSWAALGDGYSARLWALADCLLLLGCPLAPEMRRLELLTLVELVEVGSIFVDRLRSLLVLYRDPESHIFAINRIATRVKLLNSLCQMIIYGVTRQHRRLI